jgi:hypothetical protein
MCASGLLNKQTKVRSTSRAARLFKKSQTQLSITTRPGFPREILSHWWASAVPAPGDFRSTAAAYGLPRLPLYNSNECIFLRIADPSDCIASIDLIARLVGESSRYKGPAASFETMHLTIMQLLRRP